MSFLSRLVAKLKHTRHAGRDGRLLRTYLRIRRELLPGSEVIFVTDEGGNVTPQVCPECRSIDFETGDWLGAALRCRDCYAVVLTPDGGPTLLLAKEDRRPRPL